MKKLLLTVMVFLTINRFFAQNNEHDASHIQDKECITDELMKQIYLLHPEILDRQKQSERSYQTTFAKTSQTSWRSSAEVITIPVVVHVMYLSGTPVGTNENISNAAIEAGIQHLTQAFRKQTTEFNGVGRNSNIVGVDVELEFCLAKRDPNGNSTTGINRVATNLSNLDLANSANETNLKNLSRWDTERYLNIWLVKEICSGSSCGTAGFAYYSSSHGQPWDGVVNEARYFGSSPSNSKVHIHEVGHYFNLAHTFGDGSQTCTNNNCLTDGDRVCDTPPDISTSAVTCGAAQNSCTTDANDTDVRNPYRSVASGGLGDQVDLYEDYMDYGFQNCQNTYTNGQKTRMRAALDGDRVLLKSSLGCVSPTTAALAYFPDAGGSTNESAATTTIDCRKYADVSVPIRLLNASTSAVTVNLAVGAGTASNNADFQLMTPSVSIAAGSISGNATLRIFNDKAIESTKTIVLNISSATAGVATFNNSFTYSILDDDVAPSGARPIIYSSDFTGISDWTISTFNSFTANAFTSGPNGGNCTTGNSLYVTNNTTTKPNTYTDLTGWPLIYRTFNAAGYTGLQAKFDYKVGGSSANASAMMTSRNSGGSGSFSILSMAANNNVSCSQNYTYSFPTSYNNSNFEFGFAFRTTVGAAVTNPSFTIDNLEISANATPISSTITSISEYLGPNSTVNFSTATGELLTTIQNLSNHDYGCTTVEIDRAGTATVSNAGKTFTSKTFKVTPTTNNASGQSRITLYYSGNEVSGWTNATGASVNAMSVFKSSGAISAASSFFEGSSVTSSSFGTSTAFSATFNTGFSGFGIANGTVLAVDLLAFEGIKGNKNVKLRWKTASEKNNDYFIIEKSRDGQTFESLTKIGSQGASNDILNYETLDNTPSVGMNYYRLKSVDKGGQMATSKVVSVAFVEKIKLMVYPNPTSSSTINVELTSNRDDRIDFEVVDIVGRTVQNLSQNVTNGLNTIVFDNLTISKGLYFIRAKQNDVVTGFVRFVRL